MRESYSHYGLTGKEARAIMKECRAGNHAGELRAAAHKAAPFAAEYIIQSVTKKLSYDFFMVKWELREIERMPCGRSDFYGFRRQTIAILRDLLRKKETA